MNIASTILTILSAAVNIFTILCFIDIILSWFPGARFTPFGRTITAICEPYMSLFSRISFLHIGNIDFSPILSIGLLSILSSVLGGITATGRIYFGGILGTVFSMLWNVSSSLLSIFFLVILIRCISLFISKGYTPYNSAWNNVDRIIQNFSYRIAGTFIKKNMSYLKSLIITCIAFFVILSAGSILIKNLIMLCYKLPF